MTSKWPCDTPTEGLSLSESPSAPLCKWRADRCRIPCHPHFGALTAARTLILRCISARRRSQTREEKIETSPDSPTPSKVAGWALSDRELGAEDRDPALQGGPGQVSLHPWASISLFAFLGLGQGPRTPVHVRDMAWRFPEQCRGGSEAPLGPSSQTGIPQSPGLQQRALGEV